MTTDAKSPERDDIAKDRANAIADRDAVRAMALNGGRLANENANLSAKLVVTAEERDEARKQRDSYRRALGERDAASAQVEAEIERLDTKLRALRKILD